MADLQIYSTDLNVVGLKATPPKIHPVVWGRHTNLWTERVLHVDGALVLHLHITSSITLQAKHAGEFSQMQQHPGTLCSILCLTERCLSSNAALRPHPCWTMTTPPQAAPPPGYTVAEAGVWTVNEAGRPQGPTRAQSRSSVGLKLSSGQQVGHMNTSLTEWKKLGGGKMKSGLRVNAETLKKWWMTGEEFGRNWKKTILILRHYIRDLKGVREGELILAEHWAPSPPLICAESIPHCNSSSQSQSLAALPPDVLPQKPNSRHVTTAFTQSSGTGEEIIFRLKR